MAKQACRVALEVRGQVLDLQAGLAMAQISRLALVLLEALLRVALAVLALRTPQALAQQITQVVVAAAQAVALEATLAVLLAVLA